MFRMHSFFQTMRFLCIQRRDSIFAILQLNSIHGVENINLWVKIGIHKEAYMFECAKT